MAQSLIPAVAIHHTLFGTKPYEVTYYVKKGSVATQLTKTFESSEEAHTFFETATVKHYTAHISNYVSQQQYIAFNISTIGNDYKKTCLLELEKFVDGIRRCKTNISIDWFIDRLNVDILELIQDIKPANGSKYTQSHTRLVNELKLLIKKHTSLAGLVG